jgi:CxxC motif-containing protein (DUF1111 family)
MSARVIAALSVLLGVALVAVGITAPLTTAQSVATTTVHDPGVRGGSAGAGGMIPGLTAAQQAFFNDGLDRFQEIDSVSGTIAGTGSGLGPRFNLDQCSGCHAQPAVGGTSPFTNPQAAFVNVQTTGGRTACAITPCNPANLSFTFTDGQPFIRSNGPVREARFIRNPDGTADGGVHDLFTIAGRSDAAGCTLTQPDFATANTNHNLIARIPTPTFGGGLIQSISDATIIANKHANASAKAAAGISGHENREGNAGTITRFGWKAQNKSLQIFSGEAYLVEQGVSNEEFTQERGEPGLDSPAGERVEPNSACLFNGTPEDATNFTSTTPLGTPSDAVGFSLFMELLAPPTPACNLNPNQFSPASSNCGGVAQGFSAFNQIGCGLCHTPSLQTGKSSVAALSNQSANLFSDLLVHKMGTGLADGVSQGNAAGDEFRTAPLWGLGQRIFFLHDGRTKDLLQAIVAHSGTGSEANGVINRFNALSASDQQNILNFLRAL